MTTWSNTLNESFFFSDEFIPGIILYESLYLEDLEINDLNKVYLYLFETLTSTESSAYVRRESTVNLFEAISFAEEIPYLQFKKLLAEPLAFSDKKSLGWSEGHATFRIELWRNSSSLEVERGDVVRFEVTKVLSDEVGGGFVLFDNSKTLDYRTGDEIRIYWASETSVMPSLIFSGEVDRVKKEWDEEEAEQLLRLEFLDWGKLLLETKIEKSYPKATDINTIIEEILADLKTTNDPPYPNERKINLDYVVDSAKTRTVDFVGESLFDCLKKIAFISQFEFYVDPFKRLQFFPNTGNTTGLTLTMADFEAYRYQTREDDLVNTLKVFGHPNKCRPWDKDSEWTEGISSWDASDYLGVTLALDSSMTKAGTYSVKISKGGSAGEVYLGVEADFGENIDLTKKQSFTKLKWANRIYVPSTASSAYGKEIKVFLEDSSNHGLEYKYRIYPNLDRRTDEINFVEMELPVGPDHEEEGEWETGSRSNTIPISGSIEVNSYDGSISTPPKSLTKDLAIFGYDASEQVSPFNTLGVSPYLHDADANNIAGIGIGGGQVGAWTFYSLPNEWYGATIDLALLYVMDRWNNVSPSPSVVCDFDTGSGYTSAAQWTVTWTFYSQHGHDVTSKLTTAAKVNALKMRFYTQGSPDTSWDWLTYSYLSLDGTRYSVRTKGSSPYLDTNDDDTSYAAVSGQVGSPGTLGIFNFQDLGSSWAGATITGATLTVRAKWINQGTQPNLQTYIDVGSGWQLVDTTLIGTTYQDITIDVSSIVNSVAKANALRLKFHNSSASNDLNDIRITYAKLDLDGYYVAGEFTSGTFDWTKVRKVIFQWKIYRDTTDLVQINLDWLHFDEGKWYGVDSDTTSMQDPPTGNGIKYKEIFDDTLYSDTAASRWAKEMINKYKDPIDYIVETVLLRDNMESMKPGDIYTVSGFPEQQGTEKDFRIISITYKFDDENFFEVNVELEEV